MEVHHHPDLHHRAKKWKEYFFEYLMIVLAVTTGFIAESLREYLGDRAKEKEYMSSLVAELKFDTAQYNTVLSRINFLKPSLDSLYTNVKDARANNYQIEGKWNHAINDITMQYRPSMPVIHQLESSGNLRLIENKLVGDRIMEYEAFVKGPIEQMNNYIQDASVKIWDYEDKLCDYSHFVQVELSDEDSILLRNVHPEYYTMHILVKDSLKLNEFANSFVNYKVTGTSYSKVIRHGLTRAADLISLIKEEYHFTE